MDTIVLRLHDLSSQGDAVGRHEGKVVFVPLGLPGELVRVALDEDRGRYARARLLDVLDPSPERVQPPCPYYGLCGGCHLQHMTYAAQLAYKQGLVRSQLQKIAHIDGRAVRPILGMDEPWAYRNHIQLSSQPEGLLGFQAWRSHEIIAVESCLLTHPFLDEIWEALDLDLEGAQRVSLRAGLATGEQMLILEGDDSSLPELEVDVPISCVYLGSEGELVVMAGDSYLHEELGGRRYRISAPSFFQVNTAQAERMLSVVEELLDPRTSETLVDAYCGVGALSLFIAPKVGRVVGIESSPWAIEDALHNANEQDAVEFRCGAVEDVLPELDVRADAIVLDPPRSGCSPRALQALLRCAPRRIVYVSCDVATLARDVRQLVAKGYELAVVQPIDMFPQTHHIESVALLRRRQSLS